MKFDDYALYVQPDQTRVYSDIVVEETFVIGISAPHEKREQVKGHLYTLASQLQSAQEFERDSLQAVRSFLETIGEEDISLTVLLVKGLQALMITRGHGVIYLHRGDSLQRVLSENKHAKGTVRPGDYITCSTQDITTYFTHEHLQSVFDGRGSQEIMEELQSELDRTHVDQLFIILSQVDSKNLPAENTSALVGGLEQDSHHEQSVLAQPVQQTYPESPQEQGAPPVEDVLETSTPKVRFQMPSRLSQLSSKRNSLILFAIVGLLLAIVIWSVIFGTSRRAQKVFDDRVSVTKSSVEGKIQKANETAILDINQAVSLLNDAQKELDDLANYAEESNIKNTKGLDEIRQELEAAKATIEKTNESKSSEYYDFALIDKNAKVDSIYRDEDMLVMLDTGRSSLYVVSAGEKSAEEYKAEILKKAKKAFISKGVFYALVDNDGIYEIPKKGSVKKVISVEDWGSIADAAAFNGNIYLLDPMKNALYKYLVASEGFSGKKSYFSSGSSSKLSNSKAFSIDGAVYVATPETVHKFLSGASESFPMKSPDSIVIDDIFTAEDSEDVYVLDKTNQKIVVFSKDGSYKKQYISGPIKTARDFTVLKDGTILLLEGTKLLKLE